jgi:hypothetical protein
MLMTVDNKAHEQYREAMWRDLCGLWARYVNERPKVPMNPDAVFDVLLGDLVSLAQGHRVDNKGILITLCSIAVDLCEPEDNEPASKLHELLVVPLHHLVRDDAEVMA